MTIELLRTDERGLVLHAPTLADCERCEQAGGVLVADYSEFDQDKKKYVMTAGDYRFEPARAGDALTLIENVKTSVK